MSSATATPDLDLLAGALAADLLALAGGDPQLAARLAARTRYLEPTEEDGDD